MNSCQAIFTSATFALFAKIKDGKPFQSFSIIDQSDWIDFVIILLSASVLAEIPLHKNNIISELSVMRDHARLLQKKKKNL